MGSFLRLLLFSNKFDWLGRAASLLASPLPPYGRAWRGEIGLRVFRFTLFVSVVLLLAFGFVYRSAYPDAIDSMVLRVVLAAGAGVLWMVSYRSRWIRKNATSLLVPFAYVLLAWFGGLTYLNDLSYGYSLGLLFVYIAAAILCSLSFDRIRPLAMFLLVGLGAITVMALAVREPEAYPPLLILCIASAAVAMYVLVSAYIQSMVVLDRQHEALVEAQERAQLGNWEFDPQTASHYWSEGMFTLLAMDPEQDRPRIESVLRRIVPEDRSRVVRMLQRNEPYGIERVRIHTKDGVQRMMMVTCRIECDERGQAVHYSGTIRDVTEETRREEALVVARDEADRARAAAEDLAELKSTLLANMSHEIRTPLTAIIGFSEMLATEVEGAPREYADMVLDSGRRLLHTLNSVLDLARLSSGNLQLTLRPLDVLNTLDAVTRMFQSQVEEKGLAMKVAGRPQVALVLADALALERILTNLVSNAVKFTDSGEITLSVASNGSQVVIDVSDTGCGMAPEFLPRLFEEFRQESEGVTREHEGSGLGLAITQQLVELMNGQITVETALGQGTTFSVSLPAAAATYGEIGSGEVEIDAKLTGEPHALPWS